MGHPLEAPDFSSLFRECFKGSFDAYSSLMNERLFEVRPLYIERWVYKNGIPYIETFDFAARQYSLEKYMGE